MFIKEKEIYFNCPPEKQISCNCPPEKEILKNCPTFSTLSIIIIVCLIIIESGLLIYFTILQ